MPGFLITVSSNNRIWYLLGTILFVLIGIGLAIGGFAAGSAITGIVGVAFALAAIVLLIDAIFNLS